MLRFSLFISLFQYMTAYKLMALLILISLCISEIFNTFSVLLQLPWKTLKSIVEYYYMWKTTDRYVQQARCINLYCCWRSV